MKTIVFTLVLYTLVALQSCDLSSYQVNYLSQLQRQRTVNVTVRFNDPSITSMTIPQHQEALCAAMRQQVLMVAPEDCGFFLVANSTMTTWLDGYATLSCVVIGKRGAENALGQDTLMASLGEVDYSSAGARLVDLRAVPMLKDPRRGKVY